MGKKNGIRGVHPSRGGVTVGITLRLPVRVLEVYDAVAREANAIDLRNGGPGRLTAQDVMRHRLASLPLVRIRTAAQPARVGVGVGGGGGEKEGI